MCVSGIEGIILGGCVCWMFDGYIYLRVNCGLSLVWYVQMRERWTHHHQLDRVGHEPHGGLQDVMVEVWGQHPPVLEPHLPLQQKTIPWPQMGVCGGGGVRETGSGGWLGTSQEDPRFSGGGMWQEKAGRPVHFRKVNFQNGCSIEMWQFEINVEKG